MRGSSSCSSFSARQQQDWGTCLCYSLSSLLERQSSAFNQLIQLSIVWFQRQIIYTILKPIEFNLFILSENKFIDKFYKVPLFICFMKQCCSTLDPHYKNWCSTRDLKTRKKINYDQLIYNYLESSLAGEVIQHVESTKKWLKQNKKEGKKVVKTAEAGLKKTLESHLSASNQIFCSQKKTLTRVISNFKSRVQNANMFDKQRMQKIIAFQQRDVMIQKKKVQSQRKIKSYLHLISKLDKKKGQQKNKNYALDRSQPQTHKDFHYKSVEYDKGKSLFRNQELNISYNNTAMSNLSSKQHSLQTSLIEANSAIYHPALSDNLGKMYEGKKKNRNRLKFMLNRGKNGQFC